MISTIFSAFSLDSMLLWERGQALTAALHAGRLSITQAVL